MYTRYPQQPKQLQSKSAGPNTRCQKCLKFGHHTYECSNPRPYQARPSRTQQLEKGKLGRDEPSVSLPDEFKKDSRIGLADRILQAKEEERKRLKAIEDKKAGKGKGKGKASKRRDSSSSGSESDSDSASDSISSSGSSPRARRRRKRYSSDSGSDSDSRSPPPRRRPRSLSDSRSPPPRRRDSPAHGVEASRRRSQSPVRRPADGSRSPVKRYRDERD